LWDNYYTPSTTGIVSGEWLGLPAGSNTVQCADDFVIPAGETWDITEVLAPGFYSAGLADNWKIEFLTDAAGTPGTVIETRVVPASGDTVMGTFPTVTLGEGTYWISVMGSNNTASTLAEFRWNWYSSEDPGVGLEPHLNDLAGFFGGTAGWVTFTSLGIGQYANLMFQIYGELGGGGGNFPEVLYYQFNESGSDSTENLAVPGSGFDWAPVLGAMTMGAGGQFGAGLIGSGNSSSTDYVNTGWITDIGTSDWTISLYLNNMPAGTALNYLFGDNTASSWRCFYSGAAGEFGVLMRLSGPGGTDITVPGVGPGPSVLTFVYDSSIPEVLAYINGVLAVTQPQAGTLNIIGTDPMKVGGYSTSSGLPAGSFMDEFRFYNRALDAAEVAATWNIQIPVELTSFTASVGGNNVTLNWETATEINNSGFAIERKFGTSDFVQVGFVAGHGTTTEPQAYSFTENSLMPGIYSYRLKQLDFDGTFDYSNVVEVEVLTPGSYTLAQNYPNPFNPSTKITFSLADDSKVTLKIFDLLGQEVTTLVNQDLTAGVYNYDFNATGINSGVYFYKIEAVGVNGNEFVDIKKMMLLK
jgi:hypothetical protein